MKFTGERYLPEVGGEIRLEHFHRYAFCAEHVRGKRVLDAACGEGYGSALLSQTAVEVVGLDVSSDSVAHAESSYGHLKNLKFVCGDATALKFADSSFDVVVSFETLEHLTEQDRLLAGFARVLRPGGLLLMSSPDRHVYSDIPNYRNEFHVRELYRHELEALVRRHFKRHRLLGQRLAGGSAIFVPAGDKPDKLRRASVLVDDGERSVERPVQLQNAVYLIVMATNGGSLPAASPSILLSEHEDPLLELKRIARWASGVHDELMAAKQTEEATRLRLQAEVAAEQGHVSRLAQQLAESSRELQMAQDALAEEQRVSARRLSSISAVQLELSQARLTLTQAETAHQQLTAQSDERVVEHRQAIAALEDELNGQRAQAEATQRAFDAALLEANAKVEASERLLGSVRDGLQGRLAESQARAVAAEQSVAALQAALSTALNAAQVAADGSRRTLETERQEARRREDHAAELAESLRSQMASMAEQLAQQAAARVTAEADAAQQRDSLEHLRTAAEQQRQAHLLAESDAQMRHEAQQRAHAEQLQAAAEREGFLQAQQVLLAEELAAAQASMVAQRRTAEVSAATLSRELAAARMRLQQHQLALSRIADEARSDMERVSALARRRGEAIAQACWAPRESLTALVSALDAALADTYANLSAPKGRRINAESMEIQLATLRELHGRALQALKQLDAIPGPTPDEVAPTALALRPPPTPRSMAELLRLPTPTFVAVAYRAVLGREADADGLRHYTERIQRGEHRLRVVADLRLSPEGAKRQPVIEGLDEALATFRRSRVPGLGRAASRQIQAMVGTAETQLVLSNDLDAKAHQPNAQWQQRFDRIDEAVDSLAEGSALLAEAVPLAVALGKAPRALALDAWTCAKEVVRLRGEAFVRMSYALLLQRDPADSEIAIELGRLLEGASRAFLIEQIIGGSECQTRFGGAQLESVGGPQAQPNILPSNLGALVFAGLPKMVAPPLPAISVILIADESVGSALRSLRFIAAQQSMHAFEVIVATANEPLATAVARVQGIKVVRGNGARGLPGACDAAARQAQGNWVCFLCAGGEPQPGWLDELRRTFDIFPGTGMAVSRHASGNAKLISAHAIDGSGQGLDCAHEAMAPRGPSLMVQRLLFDACGGMGEQLCALGGGGAAGTPGSLSARLQARGYRSVIQPCSLVFEPSWASESSRVEAMLPATGRVLVIEQHLPRPNHDAGSLCITNLLLMLREIGLRVTLAVSTHREPEAEALALFQRSGIHLLCGSSAQLADHLRSDGACYSASILCRPDVMALWHIQVRAASGNAPLIYYPHDLHYLRLEREAALKSDTALAQSAHAMKRLELELSAKADVTIVVSETECHLLAADAPSAKVVWLPIAQDVQLSARQPDQRDGLLFVGSFDHPPNLDAAEYLLDELLPRIRQRLPGIRLTFVGDAPPEYLLQRGGKGVRFAGHVPDLMPLLEQSQVMLAPLRFGAGAKGKVIRAMCAGLPVVASSVAAEGLGVNAGEHLLVSDDPEAYAEAVVALCRDPALWRRTSESARRHALREWAAGPSTQRLRDVLSGCAVVTQPPRFPSRLFREDLFMPLSAVAINTDTPTRLALT